MIEALILFFVGCMSYYAAFIVRCGYFFRHIPPPAISDKAFPTITVIIPARNEAERVDACLRAVLAQEYTSYEVILIDDDSSDTTGEIAEAIAATDTRLRVLRLRVGTRFAYKKAAITEAIGIAQGSIIVQTDADCVMDTQWLATLSTYFADEQIALVSAPVRLTATHTHGWAAGRQLAQQFEYAGLMAIGAGALAGGTANMCNGANLAYRKAVFHEVGGFAGVDGFASGDDEMLLQKIRQQGKYHMAFAKDTRAIVSTPALDSWNALRAQRIRWVSKARYYPDRRVNITQIFSYLAFLGFPVLATLALWDTRAMYALVGIFLLKVVADSSLMLPATRFLGNLRLLRYLLPMQFVYALYVLWIGIAGNFVKTYTWKGRTVQ